MDGRERGGEVGEMRVKEGKWKVRRIRTRGGKRGRKEEYAEREERTRGSEEVG